HYNFTEGKNRQIEVYSWLRDYVATLEKNLQGHLDQWFNFFPFWSEKPSPPLSRKTKKERHYLCTEANRQSQDSTAWEFDERRFSESESQGSIPPGGAAVKLE